MRLAVLLTEMRNAMDKAGGDFYQAENNLLSYRVVAKAAGVKVDESVIASYWAKIEAARPKFYRARCFSF